MRNAAERKDIRRAEKEAKLAETLRLEFIANAMATKSGRAWFYNFLVACHIFNDPFTGDALAEALQKGQRSIGLKVYTDIMSTVPHLYVTMWQEAKELEIINDRRSNPSRTSADEFDGESLDGWNDFGSEPADSGDETDGSSDRYDDIYGNQADRT